MKTRHRGDDVSHDHRRRAGRSRAEDDHDAFDEIDDSQWDDVVDVVCLGSGRLGVAVAAAVRRAGLDVMVADAPADTATRGAEHLDERLGITDEQTVAYLRALTEDFTPLPAVDSGIASRVVDGPLRAPVKRGRLETFFGVALRDWARSCVSSPYGLLYTRVFDPVLRVRYPDSIEATVLGSVDIDPGRAEDSVEHWLSAIELPASGAFARLLFDDGMVIGAVLDSPDGERTVRARHGVMLPFGDGVTAGVPGNELEFSETVDVALVFRAASRFARLEFLVREPR